MGVERAARWLPIVGFAAMALACASSPSAGDGSTQLQDAGAPDDSGLAPVDGGAVPDAGRADGALDAGNFEVRIRQVAPSRAPVEGGVGVTIEGGDFYLGFATGATDAQRQTHVFFGEIEASGFRIIDNDTLETTAPPQPAGAVDLVVTNGNGTARCQGCFTYFASLRFDSLAPARGPTEGGTEIELEGAAFSFDLTVLVGARASPKVAVIDGATARAVVPKASSAGPADVRVFSKNGAGEIRRGFTYYDRPRLDALDPPFGPLGGGTTAALRGLGLSAATEVRIGAGLAALSPTGGASPTIVTPAGAALGPAEVAVATPDGTDLLSGGFVYLDPAATALALTAVRPTVGPSAGNNPVTLIGAGLATASAVLFGGQAADLVGAASANSLTVKAPPGPPGARVDVSVRDGAGSSAALAAAYHYALAVRALAPASGSAAGGDLVEIQGGGFSEGLEILFGALAATDVHLVDAATLRVRTPAGAGTVDVTVRDRAERGNRDTLVRGYAFLEPLAIAHLSPESGSIAGGTYVTALGHGFAPGVTLRVGGAPLKDLGVLDEFTLVGRTPPGSAGAVDVAVERASERDLAPGAFTYFDPTNAGGGSSGGPLDGTLNVTALAGSGRFGQPVPRATVMLGIDPNTPFQAQTDRRGQVTFSDPSLFGAQQVTVFKEGFVTFSASHQIGQNLTVFLQEVQASSPSPDLGTGLGSSGPALISGHVLGFKLPRPLAPNEIARAEVWLASTSVSLQPRSGEGRTARGERWLVEQDGGTFTLFADRGLRALYAVFGIYDKTAASFAPLLMGVRRDIQADPDRPAVDQDIVLDMHLDQDVPVTILNPLTVPGPRWPAINDVFAWMELGGQGLIPLGHTAQEAAQLTLTQLPRLDGDSLLFLNHASLTPGLPESYCYRKQLGEVGAGVTIGPMLGMLQLVEPAIGDALSGALGWSVASGPEPDLIQLDLSLSSQAGAGPLWHAVLSGADRQVALPPPVLASLAAAAPDAQLSLDMMAARLPRFEFGYWSFDDLGASNWTCWTRMSTRLHP